MPTPNETPRFLKRYRLEIELESVRGLRAQLPEGYRWQPWHPLYVPQHAQAKWESFREELDSELFPCLGSLTGCKDLMVSVMSHRGFVPAATWLIEFSGNEFLEESTVATIQCVAVNSRRAAIQNVGVVPGHRGQGLGRALLLKALSGCRAAGLEQVYLDVTACNTPALQLYQSIGFKHISTCYREIPNRTVPL